MLNYRDLTNIEFKNAVRAIVRTSTSKEEIQNRITAELNYPHTISIHIHQPTDQVGREARLISSALGGLMNQNNAMVMITMWGKDGESLSL